ncbi:MAG: rod-binding protein [Pseudomonadota bacterium]
MEAIGANTLDHQLSAAMGARGQSGLENVKNKMAGADPQKMEKTREAAEEFEATFLSQMLAHMFSGIEVDPTFGGGKGEEMFRSMMVEEYGKSFVDKGGVGIADQVQAKLIEMQSQL